MAGVQFTPDTFNAHGPGNSNLSTPGGGNGTQPHPPPQTHGTSTMHAAALRTGAATRKSLSSSAKGKQEMDRKEEDDKDAAIAVQLPSATPTSILLVNNTQDLANFLVVKRDHPLANRIAHKMINLFADQSVCNQSEVDEITQLIHTSDGIALFEVLLQRFLAPGIDARTKLGGIRDILKTLQKLHFRNMVDQARGTEPEELPIFAGFFASLLPSHLVETLRLLTTNMNSRDPLLLQDEMYTIIALLALMTLKKVSKVERATHEAAYQAIAKFADDKDLRVAYLGTLSTQLFISISNDETWGESAARRTFHVLKGLVKFADHFSILEPWHIPAGVMEAAPEFGKAIAMHELMHDWYIGLLAINEMYLAKSHVRLMHLLNRLLEKPEFVIKAVKSSKTSKPSKKSKRIDFQNPFLLVGFVDLLVEILHSSKSSKELQQKIVSILGQIALNNIEKKEDLVFCIEKKYRDQLIQMAVAQLVRCLEEHPDADIRAAAQKILLTKKIQQVSPAASPRSHTVRPKTDFFGIAVREVEPLLFGMQAARRRILQDKQFIDDSQYFVPLDAREVSLRGTTEPKPLFDLLRVHLADQRVRVITIEAEGGAGKSLGMQIFSLALQEEYNPGGDGEEASFFPFFIGLSSVSDPTRSAITETLEERGIRGDTKDELKRRKVVYIFDAVDEIYPDDPRKAGLNLWRTNSLSEWQNARCIFTCKSGLQNERVEPTDGEMRKLELAAFDRKKILEYVETYYKKQKPGSLPWTLDQYLNVFHILEGSGLWSVITNPFRLSITVRALPAIVGKHADTKTTPFDSVFKDKTKKEIQDELFYHFVCQGGKRTHIKMQVANQTSLKEYVEYSVQVAMAMDAHNEQLSKEGKPSCFVIPWPAKAEARSPVIVKRFGELFEKKQGMLLNQCLITVNKGDEAGWTFIHGDYYLYLVTLGKNPEKLEALITDLPNYDRFLEKSTDKNIVKQLNKTKEEIAFEYHAGQLVKQDPKGIRESTQDRVGQDLLAQLAKLGYDVSNVTKKEELTFV